MKRVFTKELKEYLEEYWGHHNPITIARRFSNVMGREISVKAVAVKAQKMGLGTIEEAYNIINAKTVAKLLNTHDQRLLRLGIPYKKLYEQSHYNCIEVSKFWKWAYEHREELDFSKYEQGPLSPEPKWFKDYKSNKGRDYKIWTVQEEKAAMIYWDNGKTAKEIADKLGISENKVKRKIGLLREKKYKVDRRRTTITEDIAEQCKLLRAEGKKLVEIAEILGIGRSTAGLICDKGKNYGHTRSDQRTVSEADSKSHESP